MLIFISDLHLTDGTFDYTRPGQNKPEIPHDIPVDAFRLFWDEIYRIYKANRKLEDDGRSRITKITVVLLGDIFEMRTTTRWVDSDTIHNGKRIMGRRPWTEPREAPSDICFNILKAIIHRNRSCFRYLSLKKLKFLAPTRSFRRLAKEVPLKFIFVPGNHDSLIVFHRSNILRNYIKEELGWRILTPDPETGDLKFLDEELGVVADHGHKLDFVDFYKDYYHHPIGSLLSDTTGRLMSHFQRETNERLKRKLVVFGMNMDNVRPSSDQLDWLIGNLSPEPAQVAAMKRALILSLTELTEDAEAIVHFLYPMLRERIPWFVRAFLFLMNPFPGEEEIVRLTLSGFLGLIIFALNRNRNLRRTLIWLNRILGWLFGSGNKTEKEAKKFGQKAGLKGVDWSEPDIQYLIQAHDYLRKYGSPAKPLMHAVFGHSHEYKLVPLGPPRPDQPWNKAFYFNSGTWKRTIQKSCCQDDALYFQKWSRMTYVTFFDWGRKENKDHVFDVWTGNLQFKADLRLGV